MCTFQPWLVMLTDSIQKHYFSLPPYGPTHIDKDLNHDSPLFGTDEMIQKIKTFFNPNPQIMANIL